MTDASQKWFTVHPHLQARWRKVGRASAFKARTPSELRAWRRQLSATLRKLTGMDSMERAPLKPRVTEEKDMGDYVRQRVEIQTEPGVIMPLYALVPKPLGVRRPAVVAPHGHCSGGKVAVAGCREVPGLDEVIRTYNYDYGVQFAKAGFVAFCPDARGFGERQEKLARSNPLGSSCLWISNMAVPLGQTVTGMWAWDIHRLLDYIQARPDCLPDRIGCAGLSGGGLQTLWAAALDERIRCAVISGYMYGYKESLLDQHGNCACNYVPHLYEHADMGDIGALIAPRPVLVETGTRDPLNGASGLKNVTSQVGIMRRAYRLLGQPGALRHDIFEGEHLWHGVEAIPWMRRWLMGREGERGGGREA